MTDPHILYEEAVTLLASLIAIPSFSKEEVGTAALLYEWLEKKGITAERKHNNVYARNFYYDAAKPVMLLNSHHDTVKPAKGYTKDPFQPVIENGRLYGLGSNDAGASLVSLVAVFRHFYKRKDLPYNLVLAATAEEEISGAQGIASLLPELGKIDCAIVGEPTQMQMAVAERGLMVVDVIVKGISGHAARNEGVNAIYLALEAIEQLRQYRFEKVSELLGPVTLNVTVIETENKAHNVVPDVCRFTIDIRLNEYYTHEEVLATIRELLPGADCMARGMQLRSTMIPMEHPLVQAGIQLGRNCYGSPTLSDKALMPFPALKLGPGDSARSHTADEFIYIEEIKSGIALYVSLIDQLQ